MKRILIHSLWFGGVGAFVYGCHLVYRPLGWMVGGALLFALAMLIDREQKPE